MGTLSPTSHQLTRCVGHYGDFLFSCFHQVCFSENGDVAEEKTKKKHFEILKAIARKEINKMIRTGRYIIIFSCYSFFLPHKIKGVGATIYRISQNVQSFPRNIIIRINWINKRI